MLTVQLSAVQVLALAAAGLGLGAAVKRALPVLERLNLPTARPASPGHGHPSARSQESGPAWRSAARIPRAADKALALGAPVSPCPRLPPPDS